MMEEERFSVLNDNDLEVKGVIVRPKRAGRFPAIILAHDLSDVADSPAIKDIAKLLLDANIAVVRFDFTSGFGKSEGRPENVTISQRARDLEEVVAHVKKRKYINDGKVSVLGFGFGAMAALAAEGFRQSCKAAVLVNTPSAIEETSYTSFSERDMVRVKLKRYFHIMRAGEEVRINYTFIEDGLRLDMFRCARNLHTPVLYIAGADDDMVKPLHTERLFDRTNSKKEHLLIPGLSHEPSKKQLAQIVELALAFLKKNRGI